MLGSGDPTPYDSGLVLLLLALTVLLGIGAATTGMWTVGAASVARRSAMLIAIGALAFVLIRTPTTNGMIGAGRVISVWPAFASTCVAFLIWSWRAGRI